jgi:hypothetical protein
MERELGTKKEHGVGTVIARTGDLLNDLQRKKGHLQEHEAVCVDIEIKKKRTVDTSTAIDRK